LKHNYSIIVIEDDPLINQTVKSILSSKYERVETFIDAKDYLVVGGVNQ